MGSPEKDNEGALAEPALPPITPFTVNAVKVPRLVIFGCAAVARVPVIFPEKCASLKRLDAVPRFRAPSVISPSFFPGLIIPVFASIEPPIRAAPFTLVRGSRTR